MFTLKRQQLAPHESSAFSSQPLLLGGPHPPQKSYTGAVTKPSRCSFSNRLKSQSLTQGCFSCSSIISMTDFATVLFLNGLEPRALSKPNKRCSLSKAETLRSGKTERQQLPLPKEIKIARRTRNQPSSYKTHTNAFTKKPPSLTANVKAPNTKQSISGRTRTQTPAPPD